MQRTTAELRQFRDLVTTVKETSLRLPGGASSFWRPRGIPRPHQADRMSVRVNIPEGLYQQAREIAESQQEEGGKRKS